MAWLKWAFHRAGYVVRPYDMLADQRRWCWQPRQKCGWSVSSPRPPMHPPVLREVILGELEDWGVVELLPIDRLGGLIESLTESWLKDRRRAVDHARRATETSAPDGGGPRG